MVQHPRRWEIPPDPHHIAVVRREVATFAGRAGMDAAMMTDVQVAVSDAITNAILHGDGDCDGDGGSVRVHAEQLGDELVVRVSDAGSGTGDRRVAPVLGARLSMIAALAQGFGVRRCEGGATELSMRFALGRG